jgi:chemotaxis signal transduction protein/ABC-type nitrate/sulfonate/bicarbonate transport system substrate-binding protein
MTDVSKDITILLVEDAAIMRKIEVKTLKSLGFLNIVEARDGREAVALLDQKPGISLVISDWNMPNMDGYELVVWMRSREAFKAIPFLMATGQGDKKQENKAVEAGVSSFIAKPFDENDLRKKINEAFGLAGDPEKTEEMENRVRMGASGKPILRMAHIQITDHLILGVLKHLISKGELSPVHFELETECMPGWNQVQESLEQGHVDGACILAPIAMDLFSYGTDIKLVLLAHKSGSIFVRSNTGSFVPPFESFFKNKSFLIPHKMSVHHMLAHMFFKKIGLKPAMGDEVKGDVSFEVVAPIKMQEFLSDNKDASGFMVAEPMGTRAIAGGAASLQFLSSELWENHPCCVVTVQNEFIKSFPDAVYELVKMLVHAGKFIENKPELASEIGVAFLDPQKKLGLKIPILKNVITEQKGIKTSDLFPDVYALQQMHDYMYKEMKIGNPINLDKFIDTRFAEAACKDRISNRRESRLHDSAERINALLTQNVFEQVGGAQSKAKLNLEGKYLTFHLGSQEFGIDIMKIKEIIGMQPTRSIPGSPDYVKGVINNRGTVIPVMDLKKKFSMGDLITGSRSCIIIIETEVNGMTTKMGIGVDSVTEVLAIKAGDIEVTSSLGLFFDSRHILGAAKLKGSVKLLLDMEYILMESGMAQLAA